MLCDPGGYTTESALQTWPLGLIGVSIYLTTLYHNIGANTILADVNRSCYKELKHLADESAVKAAIPTATNRCLQQPPTFSCSLLESTPHAPNMGFFKNFRLSKSAEMLRGSGSGSNNNNTSTSSATKTAKLSKSKRSKSMADSIDQIVESYHLCTSLMELSRVGPGAPVPMDGGVAGGTTTSGSPRRRRRRRQCAPHGRRHGPRSGSEDPTKRPTRSDSDRNQARHHNHHHNHHHSHHQNHHQGRPRPSTTGPKPSTTTHNHHSSERRKTLSSVDANDVKMLALASKTLTDHVKDMTEKTRTRCCGTPGKTDKENLINHNHGPQLPTMETQNYIVDHARETTYIKGKLLGKGGFAKCYEIVDIQNGKSYACKIISKNRLSKPHQKEKIAREVELHKYLTHQNVVRFHSYFEDNDNVYIVLEHCSRKSLVHVLKIRKTVTEPEVRCYLRQLVEGCRYIHSQRIIHRDLKLGNMLLAEDMQVKIADFGLASRVEYEGEKKMTVCGTPNYIAPEVLQKKGHSYEADIWAMGCIMYALLLGRPPFETSTLKETYLRITSNKFSVPSHISPSARSLIETLLTADPARRPTLDNILQHEFFNAGYNPINLPTSCCDHAPKFPLVNPTIINPAIIQTSVETTGPSSHVTQVTPQRPKSYAAPVSATDAMQRITWSLAHCTTGKDGRARSPSPVATRTKSPSRTHITNFNGPNNVCAAQTTTATVTSSGNWKSPATTVGRPSSTGSSTGSEGSSHSYGSRPNSAEIKALPIGSSIRLYQLLASCLEQMPDDSNPSAVHNAVPLWVTKWVDYSNKYGFGFQLSDRCVGVLFNDTTRMMLSADGEVIYYNDLSNKVYSFPAHSPPREHEKKGTLLKYFAQYMDEHLIHGGDLVPAGRGPAHPPGARLVHGQGTFMKKWFRTGKAIVMYLNNGTLQVNFFDDHTKVILSPEGQDYLVTYINTRRQSVTYRLLHFRHFGCNAEIQQRLHYARRMLESIINIKGEAV